MALWLISLFSLALSLLLTGVLRRYALARGLLDIPERRSSHEVPTPRGGGVAIVLVFMLALVLINRFSDLPVTQLWALLGSGGLVAVIGFIDDHGHIPARWRLIAHAIAAVWALAWLGGLPPLTAFGLALDLGWSGQLLAVIYLVWLLNLYNFMDGIDGIAGIEAVAVCIGGAVLYGLSDSVVSEWKLPIVLASAVLGFLFWNFPKARIFMGDAGSGYVGLVLGVFSIQAAWVAPNLFWGWIILLGAFVVDATVTLLRRIFRGEKFYQAHRSHAYQYAARKYGAHHTVSLAYGGVTLVWLLPVAALVAMEWLDASIGIIVAYLPLFLLTLRYKAGAAELQEV